MTRRDRVLVGAELVIVLAAVIEVTALLAYLAGYDAGTKLSDEHRRMLDLDPIGALRGD